MSRDAASTVPSGKASPLASPVAVGAVLGMLLLAMMKYPPAAWPREFLALSAGMAAAAGLLTARAALEKKLAAPRGAAALVPLAVLLLAGWALARWSAMEIQFAGREAVLGWLWMSIAAIAGYALARGSGAPAWSALRRVMVFGAAAFGLHALFQYFVSYPASYAELAAATGPAATDLQTQSLLHALKERRVGGSLGAPNLFAAQLSMMAVFAMSLLRERRNGLRICGGASLALAAAGVLLTQSRGGLLTFLLGVSLGVSYLLAARVDFKNGPRVASRVVASLLALGAVSLTAAQAWAMQESLWQRATNISTIRERLYYWGIAVAVWREHPLAGGGPGAFELNYLRLKPAEARESQYAHSWFFQSLADLGPVGAALETLFWCALLWMLWLAFQKALAKRKSESSACDDAARIAANEQTWILIALATIGFNGLLEYSHAWMNFRIWIGFMAGGACGLAGAASGASEIAARRRLRAKLALAGLVAAGALGIVALPLAFRYQMGLQAYAESRDFHNESIDGEEVNCLLAAMHWEPDNPRYHASLAMLLTAHNRMDPALAEIKAAKKLNPLSASLEAAEADIHERLGMHDAALENLDAAVARYPSGVEYRLRRAQLNLQLGHAEAARADLTYVEEQHLPIWEYQAPLYDALRTQAAMPHAAVQ